MRPSAKSLLALTFLVLCMAQRGQADIVLTMDVGFIDPKLPYGEVDIYANSDAMDSLFGLTVDFELSAGRFDSVPGVYGLDGMVGAGNLNPVSDFFRNSDTSASLTLDFNSAQLFDGNDVLLTTLRINAEGLPDGFYSVAIVDSLADGGRVRVRITDFGHPGGFFVQSVPEPGAALSVCLGFLFLLRRSSVGFRNRGGSHR